MTGATTASMPGEFKLCTGPCGRYRQVGGPDSEFHKDKTHRDGYKSVCKDCRSKMAPGPQEPARPRKTREELETEARGMALRRLVEDHQREFQKHLGRYRKEVGLEIEWRTLS